MCVIIESLNFTCARFCGYKLFIVNKNLWHRHHQINERDNLSFYHNPFLLLITLTFHETPITTENAKYHMPYVPQGGPIEPGRYRSAYILLGPMSVSMNIFLDRRRSEIGLRPWAMWGRWPSQHCVCVQCHGTRMPACQSVMWFWLRPAATHMVRHSTTCLPPKSSTWHHKWQCRWPGAYQALFQPTLPPDIRFKPVTTYLGTSTTGPVTSCKTGTAPNSLLWK